jgi:Ca2+-binding EF-hand superfamily protein
MMKEVTLELIQMVCAKFDKDGKGTIDMSEFAMMVVRTYAYFSC